MNLSLSHARSQASRRRAGAVVGVALVATGALAVPALALSRSDDAEASTAAAVASSTTTALPTSTTLPEAEPVAVAPAPAPAPDPTVVFASWWDTATPEQRLSFQLYTMTPEEAAAFKTFVTPPPPPAPKPTTVTTNSGGGNIGGFLACVRNRESRGNYGVVNGSSGAAGAYQFLPGTWNNTARHAGRPDLVGVNPSQASPADQDAMAQHLLSWQGRSPWAGNGC